MGKILDIFFAAEKPETDAMIPYAMFHAFYFCKETMSKFYLNFANRCSDNILEDRSAW